MILRVEVGEGLDETVGDAMLLVELDGTLDGLVTDDIAMGKVLGNNAASGLLLLCNLIALTLLLLLVVAAIVLAAAGGTGDLNLSSTKLCIIEEQGSLGRGLLLEGYSGILGRLGLGNFEAGDLTAAMD